MKSITLIIVAIFFQIPVNAQERTTNDWWRGFRAVSPVELGASKAWLKDDATGETNNFLDFSITSAAASRSGSLFIFDSNLQVIPFTVVLRTNIDSGDKSQIEHLRVALGQLDLSTDVEILEAEVGIEGPSFQREEIGEFHENIFEEDVITLLNVSLYVDYRLNDKVSIVLNLAADAFAFSNIDDAYNRTEIANNCESCVYSKRDNWISDAWSASRYDTGIGVKLFKAIGLHVAKEWRNHTIRNFERPFDPNADVLARNGRNRLGSTTSFSLDIDLARVLPFLSGLDDAYLYASHEISNDEFNYMGGLDDTGALIYTQQDFNEKHRRTDIGISIRVR